MVKTPYGKSTIKALRKGRANTPRVGFSIFLTCPVELLEVHLAVEAVGMVLPQLGKTENCLRMSKERRFLGSCTTPCRD
jgi:hypothetical protein